MLCFGYMKLVGFITPILNCPSNVVKNSGSLLRCQSIIPARIHCNGHIASGFDFIDSQC